MAGTSRTRNVWEAAVAVYAGYELISIETVDHNKDEFTIACPEEDAKLLQRDYHSGTLQLADAKAFVDVYLGIAATRRRMKYSGEKTWNSEAWINGKF